MQPTDPLDDTLKRRLSYFYLAWALVLLVIGTAVLTQVTRQIGLTYGGFMTHRWHASRLRLRQACVDSFRPKRGVP